MVAEEAAVAVAVAVAVMVAVAAAAVAMEIATMIATVTAIMTAPEDIRVGDLVEVAAEEAVDTPGITRFSYTLYVHLYCFSRFFSNDLFVLFN